jgi:hypothetical protein
VAVVGSVQNLLLLVLAVASLGLTGFAALDSFRHGTNLYPAIGRQTKVFWVAILTVAFLVAVIFFPYGALSFLNVLGVVAAGVYLADVRPKLKQVRGGSSGPYGPY